MALESVDVDLNRYLKTLDREDAFDAAADARAAELMLSGKPYCPTDGFNREEAISELNLDAGSMPSAEVDRQVHDYWARLARNQAETELEHECDRCFGKGCSRCDPPEPDHYFD